MTDNFDGFPKRLKKAIGSESVNSFAKKCGVSESLLRKYTSGDSLPGTKALVAISEHSSTPIEWLATGQGPMRKKDSLQVVSSPSFIIKNLEGCEIEYKPSPDMKHIPVLSLEAACGKGALISTESIKAIFSATETWFRRELGANPANLCLIQARGDSMTTTIMPEEMLFVDHSCAAEPCDGIWVFRSEEALFIKRLQFLPGRKIKVKSDNPLYETYELNPDDTFSLLGQVIAALPLRRV